ncbi:hypothetical protein PACTADRAFT_631 [Pachysolen tannophilus NRRL Y-2460]|uniref:Uncharacterized protein n=1 Tax=Pachysolen tannophilus NRRL Y-2460 TaxID=669874 RepID=A0A1E4U2B3_PACTA|nr:hypothetical protein PACTADRAFT_631 [Pachysolen tannophilus NRRL Y-2460]
MSNNTNNNNSHGDKQQYLSLANSYSNYLYKNLNKLINETDIDNELLSKINQIHKDDDKIMKQHNNLKILNDKLEKAMEKLDANLNNAKNYLIRNKLISIENGGNVVNDNLQLKSELIDQNIRILENCVKLIKKENK